MPKKIAELDKYELALFLEEVAAQIRNNRFDVQSSFDGVEISSHNLDGFYMHLQGHSSRVISDNTSYVNIVRKMFHEKHHIQGAWIDALIDEAAYRCENYFEYRDNLVEDAWEKFYTPKVLYDVAYALWNSDDIWYSDYIQDITSETLSETLPQEAWTEE